MLLSMKEIDLLNKKYYSTECVDSKKILGINIETFKIINEFLKEIKLATKRARISSSRNSKPSKIRCEKYKELYPVYIEKVENEDKLIFSKLVNYITSEGGRADTYMQKEASNLPMHIDYKVEYKGQYSSGTYRKDFYMNEDSLMYNLTKELIKEFSEDENIPGAYHIEELMKIEAYSSYDIEFNIENTEVLKEQVSSILNSTHFKNWKFKGLADDYEKEVLGYVYGAKHEVSYHQERGVEVYNGINLDTCRYAACLMQFVKHSEFSVATTVKEKTELYNKLYPYILEMVPEEDRDIFAKLSNYMNFENEEYVTSGYNYFANTSKKDVLARLELFEEVKNACSGKVRKNKKSKKEPIKSKVNVYPFSYMFTGGSAIFKKKGWNITGRDVLIDILESDEFKNWKFSGLKTIEEENHKLEYHDKLKELNFSENSYYILGYLVNKIHAETSLSKKKDVKKKLTPIVLDYIPLKEQKVFKTLLDYFTNQDEEGLNVDARFIRMDITMINKANGLLTGRLYTHGKNKYSQISKADILEELLNNTYSSVKKIVNEDNLFDLIEFKYNVSFSIFPSDFDGYRERHYDRDAKFNIIKNVLESIGEVEVCKYEIVDSNIASNKVSVKMTSENNEVNNLNTEVEELKYNRVKIENSSEDKEIDLFDILNSIMSNTTDDYEEEIEVSKEEPKIEVVEYIVEDDETSGDNLSGQLLFAI